MAAKSEARHTKQSHARRPRALASAMGLGICTDASPFAPPARVTSVSIGAQSGLVHTICIAECERPGASCAARSATAPGNEVSQRSRRFAPWCLAWRVFEPFGSNIAAARLARERKVEPVMKKKVHKTDGAWPLRTLRNSD